jgi:hypothetical protein
LLVVVCTFQWFGRDATLTAAFGSAAAGTNTLLTDHSDVDALGKLAPQAPSFWSDDAPPFVGLLSDTVAGCGRAGRACMKGHIFPSLQPSSLEKNLQGFCRDK